MFLINFLKNILEFFYDITFSYGWSIILLSLATQIIMLPLFWIADKIQDLEKARKDRMQPALDSIKNVQNKQEKYHYTREIYRKNNYSPFYSLTGLVGLLIQIPFFLAAYWLLLDYYPLIGISFGPISDLSQPDELLLIAGISINILPFLMTFANLLAAYFYTKNQDKSEKIQLVVIAIVFLVLLYNLSAALVLFWTMNNIFAIGKNWFLLRIKSTKADLILSNSFSKLLKILTSFWKEYGFVVFLLMFSVFPLLSIYFENIEELYLTQSSILSLIIVILIFTLGITIAIKFLVKNNYKTQILVFTGLSLFFLFGHFRNLLAAMGLEGKLAIFFLGLVFLLLPAIIIYLTLKTKRNLKALSNVISILSLCLFSIVILRIMSFGISNRQTLLHNNSQTTKLISANKEQLPDIYYIILDGYASSQILEEDFNFDNSEFEDYLIEKDFYIASNSRSNYMNTFLSLGSTFNMNYINFLSDSLPKGSTNRKIPYDMVLNGNVMKYLKDKGYKTVHFGSVFGGTKQNIYADYNYKYSSYMGEFTTNFLHTTILSPLVSHFAGKEYRKTILYTFDHLTKLKNIEDPKFIFAHIVSPHPPYVFDENGEEIPKSVNLDNSWNKNEKRFYIDQLKFLNKKVRILTEEILNISENSVIIIQSDHGPAFLEEDDKNASPEFLEERSEIFNAIYMNSSNSNNKNLYKDISSVNTFRAVFNTIFDEDFKILEDSTYYSTYKNPYDFTNITTTLDSLKISKKE
ncbi:YidC/Oxa1 family membrane protein insertase [Christiangramia gaetbulicola]|uniref:YidC/Oxa1 family membrane protein insertase n=1 Tax=Christiangramia gaetbulicola TaxID=703340 RepID=A0A2T6AFK8_9FLAO|nr:membrane protein insertase YidC [Christiangramia gaetbulicola]PTX42618.1 YidC/Oxa1 family membrane protein insertase [Christiangramia gaetbulicola]